jgi:hypothetical protein
MIITETREHLTPEETALLDPTEEPFKPEDGAPPTCDICGDINNPLCVNCGYEDK